MSYEHTYGQDPAVHHIQVEHDTDGTTTHARFTCTAPPTAPCRNYPSCDCETWDPELHPHPSTGRQPAPGHEPIPQPECWIDPWLNSLDLLDLAESADPPLSPDDLHNGPIEVSFEGDHVTWQYAHVTEPVS